MLAKNGFYSEGLKNGMLYHVNRIEAYVYISYLWLYLSRNVVFALSINVRCKDKDHLFALMAYRLGFVAGRDVKQIARQFCAGGRRRGGACDAHYSLPAELRLRIASGGAGR